MENWINVLGLMSGTSLDGLDLVLVAFDKNQAEKFKILKAETQKYSSEWKSKLSNAIYQDEKNLEMLDKEFGVFLGKASSDFLKRNNLNASLIASHGHTVFHKPKQGITKQIGNGLSLRNASGIPVVNNFREEDVRLGGQGAPLVPFGDELLFHEYYACLNLGGFANASWNYNGVRYACDIGPCNMLFNALAFKLGKEFDQGGEIAKSGKPIKELLEQWNALPYYAQEHPKSLGREWYEDNFAATLEHASYTVEDLLSTAVEHLAVQTNALLLKREWFKHSASGNEVLCTGGGSYNDYLLDRLQSNSTGRLKYIIPKSELIDNKEALIFALLGLLRWQGKINILASVTGASCDHSGGDVYS